MNNTQTNTLQNIEKGLKEKGYEYEKTEAGSGSVYIDVYINDDFDSLVIRIANHYDLSSEWGTPAVNCIPGGDFRDFDGKHMVCPTVTCARDALAAFEIAKVKELEYINS